MAERAGEHDQPSDADIGGGGAIPTVVSYADPDAQWGVVVERVGNGVRVIVPRVRGWRLFINARWGGLAFLAVMVLPPFVQEGPMIVLRYPPAALWLVLLVAGLGFQLYTMWRRRVFAVTANEVWFGFLIGPRELRVHVWPRALVGEIRVNRYSGRLMVRIPGKDVKEYFVSSNRQVTQRVADALEQSLHDVPLATSIAPGRPG